MQNKLVLALDQGTTSSRAVLFNHKGGIVQLSQKPFEQFFPKPGWVEHNPDEIWSSQISVAAEVVAKAGITGAEIACIGITNQRETTIVWDRVTGIPIYNAIVWQDRRTATHCRELTRQGHADIIKQKTGLVLDAYFSGTKVKWILDNVAGAREKAEVGELCFGTVDTWLVWKLTRGKLFITDVSNASRTLLYNIHSMQWDDDLLDLFSIPKTILPKVKSSSEVYGETTTSLFASKIPIAGIAGDQQAALFGQLCTKPGMIKNTYGTGCFLLMNTGSEAVSSDNKLLTTIAWQINGKTTYALEGSVFVGGAAVQWIRDGVGIIDVSDDVNFLAGTVADTDGVYFVPALTGLGAPYWDQYARGMLIGITRGTTKAHIARATLEGIAFQVYDIVKAMEADAEKKSVEIRVDGGASASDILMQIQADLFGFEIIRPKNLETTALGVAYLAGLAVGYWDSLEAIQSQWEIDTVFEPKADKNAVEDRIHFWHKAVTRAQDWAKDIAKKKTNMKVSEFKLTTEDNLALQVYAWLPDQDVPLKGILQIAHGMAEHGKRYEEFAAFLTKNGFAVFANDHRGHGKTAGSVENLGFFSEKDGWQKVVADLKFLNQHLKEKHPDVPLFVMGHSMGSFLTRQYLMDPELSIQGAILSGTANHPGLLGKIGVLLTRVLLLFNNPKSPSPLMDSLSFKAYNSAFKPNRTAFDWLSKDEKKVDEYIADTYCGTVFSIQFYSDLLKALLYISNQNNINKTDQNIPILVFSGAKDPVGENSKGVQKFHDKLKVAGIKNLTLKLFEDGRHEMLNETNRKEVYAYILDWLNKRI